MTGELPIGGRRSEVERIPLRDEGGEGGCHSVAPVVAGDCLLVAGARAPGFLGGFDGRGEGDVASVAHEGSSVGVPGSF